ncbi:hypothetical protein B0H13DRAFT_1872987 [Mycena leptocephala]|nr:hypothetical protein B0H13DRAFT_1872987 [Mycena leptocephala]
MSGSSRAQEPVLDEDDPVSVRHFKHWHSNRTYNDVDRVECHRKKQDRMKALRAQQAQDLPEVTEARRMAAQETAHNGIYVSRNRVVLTEEACSNRVHAKHIWEAIEVCAAHASEVVSSDRKEESDDEGNDNSISEDDQESSASSSVAYYLFFQQNNAGAGTSLSVSYDLACQWAGNLRARDGGAYSAA